MNSPRLEFGIAMSLLLLVGAAVRGDETEAGRAPARFLELLHAGDTVLLRRSSEDPAYYNIQLLGDGQAEEIQKAYAAYDEAQQRRAAILAKLDTERRLNERATLFVQKETLDAEIQAMPVARTSTTDAYEVAHVGEDFVSFKNASLEKFIPLHSIHYMYRTDRLPSSRYARPSSIRGSSSAAAAAFVQRSTIRLRNTKVAEVAAAINLVYPNTKAKLTADIESNSLHLEGDLGSTQQITSIVKTLDELLPEAAPPTNQRE